ICLDAGKPETPQEAEGVRIRLAREPCFAEQARSGGRIGRYGCFVEHDRVESHDARGAHAAADGIDAVLDLLRGRGDPLTFYTARGSNPSFADAVTLGRHDVQRHEI